MTTALDDVKNVVQSFKSLCDAYLFKPIDTGKLLGTSRTFTWFKGKADVCSAAAPVREKLMYLYGCLMKEIPVQRFRRRKPALNPGDCLRHLAVMQFENNTSLLLAELDPLAEAPVTQPSASGRSTTPPARCLFAGRRYRSGKDQSFGSQD